MIWAARTYDIELGDDPLWPMSRARDQAILLNRLSQNRLRLPVAPTIMFWVCNGVSGTRARG